MGSGLPPQVPVSFVRYAESAASSHLAGVAISEPGPRQSKGRGPHLFADSSWRYPRVVQQSFGEARVEIQNTFRRQRAAV
jgi:hypothetical protein